MTKQEAMIKKIDKAIKIVNENKCNKKVCDSFKKLQKLKLMELISFTIATRDTPSKDYKEKEVLNTLLNWEKEKLAIETNTKNWQKQKVDKLIDIAVDKVVKGK